MPDTKETEQLKQQLAHANHQYLAEHYDAAWHAYDEIINTRIPLSQHRRRYLAGAHLGRAAIMARRKDFDAVDEEIRIASVTYAMDGEQTLGKQIAKLSEECYTALHDGDVDAIRVIWSAYENIRWAWIEPEFQAIALLTATILEVADVNFDKPTFKTEADAPAGLLTESKDKPVGLLDDPQGKLAGLLDEPEQKQND